MHWQRAPHAEVKLVRCTRGAVLDVLIDLRVDHATSCGWRAIELTQDNGLAVYIPGGFAHGFQTLADDTEVLYQMAEPYWPEAAEGIRWNDPAFAIDWPISRPILSDRDAAYPDFRSRVAESCR